MVNKLYSILVDGAPVNTSTFYGKQVSPCMAPPSLEELRSALVCTSTDDAAKRAFQASVVTYLCHRSHLFDRLKVIDPVNTYEIFLKPQLLTVTAEGTTDSVSVTCLPDGTYPEAAVTVYRYGNATTATCNGLEYKVLGSGTHSITLLDSYMLAVPESWTGSTVTICIRHTPKRQSFDKVCLDRWCRQDSEVSKEMDHSKLEDLVCGACIILLKGVK